PSWIRSGSLSRPCVDVVRAGRNGDLSFCWIRREHLDGYFKYRTRRGRGFEIADRISLRPLRLFGSKQFPAKEQRRTFLLMSRYLSLLILTAVLATSVFIEPVRAQEPTVPKFAPSKKAWKWADKQLSQMSVEEKVGQTVYIGLNAKFANEDSDY